MCPPVLVLHPGRFLGDESIDGAGLPTGWTGSGSAGARQRRKGNCRHSYFPVQRCKTANLRRSKCLPATRTHAGHNPGHIYLCLVRVVAKDGYMHRIELIDTGKQVQNSEGTAGLVVPWVLGGIMNIRDRPCGGGGGECRVVPDISLT